MREKYKEDKATFSTNGGIDLNNTEASTTVRREGNGVQMSVDPALIAQIRRDGITPVTNIWPIIGIEAPRMNR